MFFPNISEKSFPLSPRNNESQFIIPGIAFSAVLLLNIGSSEIPVTLDNYKISSNSLTKNISFLPSREKYLEDLFDKYLYEDDALAGEKIKKETESNHGLILNIISNEKINSELRANAARIYATHFPDKDSKEFKLNIQNISSNQFPIIRMGILYGLIEAKKSDLIYNFFSDPDSRISKEAKKYFVDGIS